MHKLNIQKRGKNEKLIEEIFFKTHFEYCDFLVL